MDDLSSRCQPSSLHVRICVNLCNLRTILLVQIRVHWKRRPQVSDCGEHFPVHVRLSLGEHVVDR
jgi:hypothetical protein